MKAFRVWKLKNGATVGIASSAYTDVRRARAYRSQLDEEATRNYPCPCSFCQKEWENQGKPRIEFHVQEESVPGELFFSTFVQETHYVLVGDDEEQSAVYGPPPP
jgi:hypothetical protein